MATDDQQVLVTGAASAPASFRIPGNGQIQPKAVFASYDGTGAAGDFVPALKIISDGGETVGIYPTESPVVAGASADVSWFPGVKPQAAAPLLESRVGMFWRTGGQTIHTGAVTEYVFQQQQGQADPNGPLGFSLATFTITVVRNFRVYVDFLVQWQAGNYDRYIEIAQPVGFPPQDLFTWRAREAVSPDGDVQHIGAVLAGNPSAPAALTFNLFQASGSDKTATGYVLAYGWPEIAGQNGWPG